MFPVVSLRTRARGGWCWWEILSPSLNLIVQLPKFFSQALRQAGFTAGRGLHQHAVVVLTSRLKQMFAFVIDDPAEHYCHRKRYDSDARIDPALIDQNVKPSIRRHELVFFAPLDSRQ